MAVVDWSLLWLSGKQQTLIYLLRARELAQAANRAVKNRFLFLFGSQMGQTIQVAPDRPFGVERYIVNG